MARRVASSKSVTTGHDSHAPLSDRLREILGPPPLFAGESEESYNQLDEHVRSAVLPEDALEEIWVRDVVDLVWEGLRLRRLKADLMTAIRSRVIYDLIESFKSNECEREVEDEDDKDYIDNYVMAEAEQRARTVHIAWKQGDQEALETVSDYLQAAGDNENVMMAEGLQENFEHFERIDRLILQSEVRRHAVLREIDRHREALARRLRDAIRDVEDADFHTISAGDGEAAQ